MYYTKADLKSEKEAAMTNLRRAGILSVATIFFWGLLNVSLRYLVVEYGCHPLAIACSNALFCALSLILIGDHKVEIMPIIKNPHTWFFGMTQILKNICLIYAFVYISSTEANLLTNIEIVFSLLLTWLFLHRRPNRVDQIALFFVLFGCLVIVAGLPKNVMFVATAWVFAGSLLTSLRSIFTEVHPGNRADLTLRQRCSVTGWILFASGGAFVLFFVVLSVISSWLPSDLVAQTVILKRLPQPAEFIALPNIIGGLVTGVLFYAISMYLFFYAISISNNEYFMMYRSLQAVCTYIVEYAVASVTVLPMIHLTAADWFAAITIILSSFSMIMMRGKHGQRLLEGLNKR